jgi:hypothetical protein
MALFAFPCVEEPDASQNDRYTGSLAVCSTSHMQPRWGQALEFLRASGTVPSDA